MAAYEDIYQAYRQNKSRETIYRLLEEIENYQELDNYGTGFTLLHLCTRYADPQALELLVNKGVSPRVVTRYGNTPLHTLAESTRPHPLSHPPRSIPTDEDIFKCTKILLHSGTAPYQLNNAGESCIHVAARKINLPFIKALHGHQIDLNHYDEEKRNPLHLVCLNIRRFIYMKEHVQDRILRLKKQGRENDTDYMGRRKIDRDNAELKFYTTKEEEAFEITRTLLQAGTDFSAPDIKGNTPLEYAKHSRASKLVLLINGDLEEKDEIKRELKLLICGRSMIEILDDGDLRALEALCKLGNDVNITFPVPPYKGLTPLIKACLKLNNTAVKILLENGANPNQKIDEDKTALFFLLRYGLIGISKKVNYERKVYDIIDLLLYYNLDIDTPVDSQQNTALHTVCGFEFSGYRYTDTSPKETLVKQFIKAGSNPNLTNKEGLTPLMVAVRINDITTENVVRLLLENGADPTIQDDDGNTALLHALHNPEREVSRIIVHMLYETGKIEPDLPNGEGKNAWDIAAEKGYTFLADILTTG